MGQFAFDVDAAGFEAAVLEASQRVPVVVDFWAPWCGPCQSLKPILEKLAGEFGGKFLLARVNTDENQEQAMQFGIRGIPDVKAFYRGQVIDQFTGALPESGVREFLARILPSPAEELRQQAAAQRAAGNDTQALETLGEASRLDPGNEQVRIDADNILSSRAGTPQDIAGAVVFLASDAAGFVNAHVLPVDGGLLAHTPTYAQTLAIGSTGANTIREH